MKNRDGNIKKTIKRRIELTKKLQKSSKQVIKMGVRDKLRQTAIPPKPVPVDLVSRNEVRSGIKKADPVVYEIKDYGTYMKPENVDYDVLIYISSFDRYEKLLNILNQLYSQETRYSFKIIVMNDGSTDRRYYYLKNKFSEIIYLKNKVNGGRALYWQTVNTIFEELKKYSSYAVIQIDDDFILAKDFINILMDKFFELKQENNSYMGIRYHIPSFNENEIITDDYFNRIKRFQAFDGGSMFDPEFLKLINYNIKEINQNIFKQKFQHSHVWTSLNNFIRELGVMVYSTRKSLAYHNGNEDSKMHPELRLTKKIYTKKFND